MRYLWLVFVFSMVGCVQVNDLEDKQGDITQLSFVLSEAMDDLDASYTVEGSESQSFKRFIRFAHTSNESSEKVFNIINEINFTKTDNQLMEYLYKFTIESRGEVTEFLITLEESDYYIYHKKEESIFKSNKHFNEGHIEVATAMSTKGSYVDNYTVIGESGDYKLIKTEIKGISNGDKTTVKENLYFIGGSEKVCREVVNSSGVTDEICEIIIIDSYFGIVYDKKYMSLTYFFENGEEILSFEEGIGVIPDKDVEYLIELISHEVEGLIITLE